MVEAGSFDPWDTGFKCKAKVLNTRGRGGKNKSGKKYPFVHSAQLGCQVKLLNTPTRDMNVYSCEPIFISLNCSA